MFRQPDDRIRFRSNNENGRSQGDRSHRRGVKLRSNAKSYLFE